jgi:hypothetical protein
MAAWQADFELRPTDAILPVDFRQRLDLLLPRGRSWSRDLETWGEETGNRIDVWLAPDGRGGEAMLRVDMRAYDHAWCTRVFAEVRALGRGFWPVWSDGPMVGNPVELGHALRGSPAFRFVEDPHAFLRRASLGGHEDA